MLVSLLLPESPSGRMLQVGIVLIENGSSSVFGLANPGDILSALSWSWDIGILWVTLSRARTCCLDCSERSASVLDIANNIDKVFKNRHKPIR